MVCELLSTDLPVDVLLTKSKRTKMAVLQIYISISDGPF